MRRAAILFLALTWTAPWIAWGEEVKPSHKEAAAELFKVLGANESTVASAMGFVDVMLQDKLELKPYRDVMLKWMEKTLSEERLAARMIDLYAEAFSEEEIRDLLAFYKTPTGKKTLEKMPILIQEGAQIGMDLAKENQAELLELVGARRREIEGASKTDTKPGPENPLGRANRLYDEKKWAEARDSYLLYLKTNSRDSSARSDLGVCYQELGAHEKAVVEFDRVLAADPGHWQALYNKIRVLGFDLDRKSEAVALLPTLLKLRPDDAAVQALAASLGQE